MIIDRDRDDFWNEDILVSWFPGEPAKLEIEELYQVFKERLLRELWVASRGEPE